MKEFYITIIDKIRDIYNDNVDVQVNYKGKNYIATLITLKNIQTLMENHKKSGESLNGSYFWASGSFIIRDLKIDTINAVIKEMIKEEEFFDVFEKVDEEEYE